MFKNDRDVIQVAKCHLDHVSFSMRWEIFSRSAGLHYSTGIGIDNEQKETNIDCDQSGDMNKSIRRGKQLAHQRPAIKSKKSFDTNGKAASFETQNTKDRKT